MAAVNLASTGPRKTSALTIRTCRCSMPCATNSACTARNSAAASASAAPAPCSLTDRQCAPARSPSPPRSNRNVTTLEGLAHRKILHPVQAAFIAEQAAQCGYCTNGMIMSTVALLTKTPRPTEAEVRSALAGNLCRCGSHIRVLRAVQRAAEHGRTGQWVKRCIARREFLQGGRRARRLLSTVARDGRSGANRTCAQ